MIELAGRHLTSLAQESASIWEAAAAVATVVEAVVVAVSVVVAAKALKAQQRQHADATRPVLIAELRPNPISQNAADLRVTNYGASPAREVRVEVQLGDDGADGSPSARQFLEQRYGSPIDVIPPGGSRSNLYFIRTDKGNHFDLPNTLTVTLRYRGDSTGVHYAEVFPLEMSQALLTETRVGWRKGNGVADAIARALQSIAESQDRRT